MSALLVMPADDSAALRSPSKRVIALVAPGLGSPAKRRRTSTGADDALDAHLSSPSIASTVSSLSGVAPDVWAKST